MVPSSLAAATCPPVVRDNDDSFYHDLANALPCAIALVDVMHVVGQQAQKGIHIAIVEGLMVFFVNCGLLHDYSFDG